MSTHSAIEYAAIKSDYELDEWDGATICCGPYSANLVDECYQIWASNEGLPYNLYDWTPEHIGKFRTFVIG
ncbi:hypothetical protein [Komagataeibacter europaeus]|uniref:hypothetical protein n=2 Tax=Acetobacteraceae TaxID=433 RepID=UPI000237D82C|nr:hypothetical protein [Komagataeibacter europaeus]